MERRLIVSLHGVPAGDLLLEDNGNMQFHYLPQYNGPPLSVALPLQTESYPHRACVAWFGGLLPEGDVRDALARVLGTSAQNQFRILNEIGGDCAGAVTILPAVWPREDTGRPVHELSDDSLDTILAQLPQRPLAANPQAGVRMSLAGAQAKLPVIFEPTLYKQTGFAIPESPSTPTTHIIKPEPRLYPGLVANEMYCLTLARAAGLAVAQVDVGESTSGIRFLIVRRYDRTYDHPGDVRRVHQEDFCQALLVRSEDKYQADGGPSFAQLSETIRRYSKSPAEDLWRLWDAAVFNWAVGNCDAHAKNYSLLYEAAAPRLAPLYDLVSTRSYPELDRRLAMSIGGVRQLDDVGRSAWEELAREMRVSPSAGLDRARALFVELQSHAPQVVHAVGAGRKTPAVEIEQRLLGLEI